jgi:hypothetical protein
VGRSLGVFGEAPLLPLRAGGPEKVREVQKTAPYASLDAMKRAADTRWDLGFPRYVWHQFSKKSFRSFVLANLKANRVGSMPVFYRLA